MILDENNLLRQLIEKISLLNLFEERKKRQ